MSYSEKETYDKGLWSTSEDGRAIESEDFTHDVILRVTGDFYNDQQRKIYSDNLASRLNNTKKNYCKTCSHRDDDNYCTSPKLVEADHHEYDRATDMLVYSYSEGGEFKVGDNFGCVHHKEKE